MLQFSPKMTATRAAVVALYAAFSIVGWFGSRKAGAGTPADLIVAGRQMPLLVAALTMTATWVDADICSARRKASTNPRFSWESREVSASASASSWRASSSRHHAPLRVHNADRSVRSAVRKALGGRLISSRTGGGSCSGAQSFSSLLARRSAYSSTRSPHGNHAVRRRYHGVHNARSGAVAGRVPHHAPVGRSEAPSESS
jgi:hypothetical protein